MPYRTLACRSGAALQIVPPRRKNSRKPRPKARPKLRRANSAAIPLNARDRAAGKWFEKLVALQAHLRAAGGCPWDREQTHESLRKFLIEETYEVLDAMESGAAREFSSELGDLLLQVIFHSIIAEEAGRFTISDVIESVHTKMVRRHPHVFGTVKAATSTEVLKNWEQLKAAERAGEGGGPDSKASQTISGEDSILSGIPRSLPAVLEAYQLTRRASRVGFDWKDLAGILEKLEEEKLELLKAIPAGEAIFPRSAEKSSTGRSAIQPPVPKAQHLEEEVGDLLFVAVNIARFLGVDPEIALKKANRKFKKRFNYMETAAARQGERFADLPRSRMEELWDESKSKNADRAH
jgi:MazG family protein